MPQYKIDAQGRLLEAVLEKCTISYEYDEMGKRQSVISRSSPDFCLLSTEAELQLLFEEYVYLPQAPVGSSDEVVVEERRESAET